MATAAGLAGVDASGGRDDTGTAGVGGWKSMSGTGRPQSSRSEKKEWLKGRSLRTCGVSIELVCMRGLALGRWRGGRGDGWGGRDGS